MSQIKALREKLEKEHQQLSELVDRLEEDIEEMHVNLTSYNYKLGAKNDELLRLEKTIDELVDIESI